MSELLSLVYSGSIVKNEKDQLQNNPFLIDNFILDVSHQLIVFVRPFRFTESKSFVFITFVQILEISFSTVLSSVLAQHVLQSNSCNKAYTYF